MPRAADSGTRARAGKRRALPVRIDRATRRLFALAVTIALCCPAAGAADDEQTQRPTSGPDAPIDFGPRTSWFAVRGTDPGAVAHALGLAQLTPANWASGLAAATPRPNPAMAEPMVFFSPPVDGWVLVVSSGLPYPDHRAARTENDAENDRRFDHLFTALAVKFSEVQYFGSYRAVGFCAWARARRAGIERIFSYADGEVLANVGTRSLEERALKFPDIGGLALDAARDALLDLAARRDRREEQLLADGLDRTATDQALRDEGRAPLPGEDDVLELAGAWSVNPAALEARALAPGTGFTARLPPQMRQ
jgi:hypothetical protein